MSFDDSTERGRPKADAFPEEEDLGEDDLTHEERTALCRAFALLDSDGDGVIDSPDLNDLLGSWGRLPEEGEKEIASQVMAVGCEGTSGMNFEGFRRCVTGQLAGTRDENELRRAFRVFDSDPPTGRLNLVELRHHLKKTGLKLTDDEIDFLFREKDYWMLEEKYIFEYEELVNKIMNKPVNSPFLNF